MFLAGIFDILVQIHLGAEHPISSNTTAPGHPLRCGAMIGQAKSVMVPVHIE